MSTLTEYFILRIQQARSIKISALQLRIYPAWQDLVISLAFARLDGSLGNLNP